MADDKTKLIKSEYKKTKSTNPSNPIPETMSLVDDAQCSRPTTPVPPPSTHQSEPAAWSQPLLSPSSSSSSSCSQTIPVVTSDMVADDQPTFPSSHKQTDIGHFESNETKRNNFNNSYLHSNALVAQQPKASEQLWEKTPNSSLNPFENEQVDIPNSKEFNKSQDSSSSQNESKYGQKNLKSKLPDDVKRTKHNSLYKKVNLKSDNNQCASEDSHLLESPGMNFFGYMGEGKGLMLGPDDDKSKREEKTPFFVYYLACFATIGGFLFGYDTGIVSGAMLLIKDYFELSTAWQEVIVSGTVAAAAVFSLIAGFVCDLFGRKVTIMMASVVFVAGAVIMAAANDAVVLLIGRIVVGIGIGFASMTVPVYIAEASPPGIRGRLVTLNQLFITIGIVISSVVAGAFSGMKRTGWRYMLGLAGIPGVIQFIGFLYLPESPRWLVMKDRNEDATRVLQRIRGMEDVHEEVSEILNSVEEDRKQTGFVLRRVVQTQHVRRALVVGCGLQVFQQLCGINTVIYYSATILTMAGFPAEDAIWLVLVPNSINFLATFIGLGLVERLGRKKLIVASFIGVFLALVVLAVGFQLSAHFSPLINQNITETNATGANIVDGCFDQHYSNCERCIEHKDCGFCFSDAGEEGSCLKVNKDDEDVFSEFGRCYNITLKTALKLKFFHGYCPSDYTWMAVLGLALFVLAFSPGLGPMPWTINSEIYPMWARSTCTAIATGANWICNLVVSLFFLTLTETITKYGVFWLFCGICFVGMIFTICFLPETKNKSLEEVEELFKRSNKSGTDNEGYLKDGLNSVTTGSNTKL